MTADPLTVLRRGCYLGGDLPDVAEVEAALAAVEQLVEAARRADRLASVAHDAVWSEQVVPASILHDGDDMESASSAIWAIHNALRPALARFEGDSQPEGER